MEKLEQITHQGANCYWDDIPLCDNPFESDGCHQPGLESEWQAWRDGWQKAEKEVMQSNVD